MTYSKHKIEKIRKLLRDGDSYREIRAKTGASFDAIRKYSRESQPSPASSTTTILSGENIETPNPDETIHPSDSQKIYNFGWSSQGDQPYQTLDNKVNPVNDTTFWYMPWHAWDSILGINCTPIYPNNSFQNQYPCVSEEQRRIIEETVSKRLEDERKHQERENQTLEIKTLKEKLEIERKRQEDELIKKLEQAFKTYTETFNKPKKLNEEKPVKTPEPQMSVLSTRPPPSAPRDIDKIIQETVQKEINAQKNKMNLAPKTEQKPPNTPYGLEYTLLCIVDALIKEKPQITESISNIITYIKTGKYPDSSTKK